jgi:hypothetical protein
MPPEAPDPVVGTTAIREVDEAPDDAFDSMVGTE